MKIKRFLLALIASSMTLAGCGKDKNASEEPQEPAPAETVEPSGETDTTGGGGSDTDPSKEEDQDKLTPAQRESATNIQNTVKLVLTLTQRYDEATINGIDEYTLAYSEEVALEDINFNNLIPAMINIMTLDTSDAEAVVDFVIELQENELLDEASYVAVAVGKSLLRAESAVNEDFSEALVYAADYLDKEGAELHENVYAFLDSIVGCASVFMSEEFSEAINSVYDAEENQVSYEKVCEVITSAGSALMQFSSGYESASYLANLLIEGLEGYAQEDLELEEETEEFEEEFDIQSVIDSIYTTTAMAGFMLSYLPAYEEFPLEHIVDLINLGLAENYGELALALFGDYMSYIGIEETEWQGGLGSLAFSVLGFYSAVQNIITNLSGDFVDSETGKFSAELLQAAVVACGAQIEGLGALSSLATAFDEYLMLVVQNTLTVVAGYEEEKAEAIASKFDFTEEIADVYASIADAGDFISNIESVFFEIVADFINGEFEEGIKALLDYVGYEGDFDAAKVEFEAIKGTILSIVGYFADEAFAEKLFEVYDAESGTIDLAKAKSLIVEIGEALEDILSVKANVINLGDVVIASLKLAFVKGGMSEAEADELFADFDVNEFVEMIFGGIANAIGFIKNLGESDDYDAYLTIVKKLVEAFLDEKATSLSKAVAVYDAVISALYEALDIQSMPQSQFEFTLMLPILCGMSIKTYLSSDFKDDLMAVVVLDSETGKHVINADGLKALLAACASRVLNPVEMTATQLVDVVDVFREIVEKIQGEYDPDVEGEEYANAKAFLESLVEEIKGIESFLNNEDDVLEEYIPVIEFYGNIVLEGLDLYAEYSEFGYIEEYKVVEYICRTASMFVMVEHEELTITSFDEVVGKVAEAINLESIQALMEEGESTTCEGSGVAFDLIEKEEVYYLEVTLVSAYSVELVEGAVTSVSVEGEVYTFELPSLEALSSLFDGSGNTGPLEIEA